MTKPHEMLTDQFESARWQELKRSRAKIALSPHVGLLLDPGPFGRCDICLEPAAILTKAKQRRCSIKCLTINRN